MSCRGIIRVDYTGRVFGRLTVTGLDGFYGETKRQAVWDCSCACGGSARVTSCNLKTGNTMSCGCLYRESRGKARLAHGCSIGAKSPEYRSWAAMRARCRAKSGKSFRLWGSRGIIVCEKWASFETFLADMGPRPPGAIPFDGRTVSLSELAQLSGVNRETLLGRLENGMTVQEAIKVTDRRRKESDATRNS